MIHYIKLHLHPYGESVSLIDTAAHRTLWTGHAKTDRVGAELTYADEYSSPAGLWIFADHQYEIRSVYNNTSGHMVDAMAVLRVYLAEP